jgi:hypothetical protein
VYCEKQSERESEMDTQNVVMTRGEARELYRAYKEHKHWSAPVDKEVQRAYQLLAQGRLVIRALDSIVKAGLNAEHLPKLAIAQATATSCSLRLYDNGSATFDSRNSQSYKSLDDSKWVTQRGYFGFPRGSFPRGHQFWSAKAQVPMVPIMHRPKRGLANYHILWEAEWKKVVPVDPFLLRRIGKADLWAVVAMWDLSDVERAALATRL